MNLLIPKIMKALSVVSYISEWYTKPGRLIKSPGLPRVLNLLVTDQCNCRCQMCNVWQQGSHSLFTPLQLQSAIRDSLFQQVHHVGISGGEPTLREDLVELCNVVLDALPRLKSLSITTNGSRPDVLSYILPAVKTLCDNRDVCFTLNISVDGLGEVHDTVRQRTIFKSVVKSIEIARLAGVRIQLQCTVSSSNVYSVESVRFLAEEYGVDIVYRVATTIARLENEEKITQIALSDNQKSFFADFLTSPATLNQTKMPGRRLFYHDLAERLIGGGTRRSPCYFQYEGVMLTAAGELYNCSISSTSLGNVFEAKPSELYFSGRAESIRSTLIQHACLDCLHDQSGAWSPFMLIRGLLMNHRATKLFKKIKIAARFFCVGYYLLLISRSFKSRGQVPSEQIGVRKGKKAFLVGCYGGEHVGDAAILGGVLQRISRDYCVNHAIIASTRPDRTRRWANSLRECIETEVISYDSAHVDASLLACDYLVFAGGPLMDLPALLVSHLETAIKARRNNIPIIIEGCGIGPFKFTLSMLIVRRLLEIATYVRLRTQASVKWAAKWDVVALLDRDPAFDYLDSRTAVVRNLVCTPESLRELFDTPKKIIGVNLRPLWQKYAKEFMGEQKIRQIEETFLEEFGHAMEYGQGDVRYIFFPMNPDQYGFSDLSMSYRLQKKLAPEIDFKIWEYEPDVDEVVYFLSRMSACITMRFHASIFALSQGIETLGIDYGVGQVSKVGDLFNERGLSDDVVNVDKLTCTWLQKRLARINCKNEQ